MKFARLEERVCRDEGFRPNPYLDTVEVATIGYGTTRILGEAVSLNTPVMSESIARQILRQDLFMACLDAQDLFIRFDEMDSVRQEVLVNMAYNMGKSRLAGFKLMLAAAKTLDYIGMAAQMRDSKWFEQVGQRGLRLYYAMQSGTW